MPAAPHTGFFTHYVLENPYPLGLLLLLAAAVIGYLWAVLPTRPTFTE